MVANGVDTQVGTAVAAALKRRGQSMAWLARQSGISYSTVKRIMAGTARIDTEKIAMLACALGVPIAELLKGVDGVGKLAAEQAGDRRQAQR